MPRPPHCRRIAASPTACFFKPAGIPTRELQIVVLTLDELEALRLADRDGLYQEQAAAQMGVSRATFGRIVDSARRKVADALTTGKALRIDGGPVHPMHRGPFRCGRWGMRFDGSPDADCAAHGVPREGPGAGSDGEQAAPPHAWRGRKGPQDA